MKPVVDHLVVTAANEAQARAYRVQLATRDMSRVKRWHVLPDPGDKRVGSGAATIAAIGHLEHLAGAEGLRGLRVLILHSGGDSRRLPAYAAQGKIFVPMGTTDARGRDLTLFDLVLEDLISFQHGLHASSGNGGSVVIAAGDVYLEAARERPAWDGKHVLGVGFRASQAVASRHGVYVVTRGGLVRRFLQKPSREQLDRARALDGGGRAIVDTGIVVLPDEAAQRLARVPQRARGLWQDVLAQRVRPLDVYEHLLMGWATPDPAAYATNIGASKSPQREDLLRLHACLQGSGLSAHIMERCAFVHLGTTREYLRSEQVVVRDCEFARSPTFDGENLVANWPRAIRAPARFAKGQGGVCVPIGARDWAITLFDVADDFKASLSNGGTICGCPLADVAKRAGGVGEIWTGGESGGGGEHSAWTAKLWPVGHSREMHTLLAWIARGGARPPAAWHAARRLSLSEIVLAVNHERLVNHQSRCRQRDRMGRLGERAIAAPLLSAAEVAHDVRQLTSEGERRAARVGLRSLLHVCEKANSASERARLTQMALRVSEALRGRVRAIPSRHVLQARVWEDVRATVAQKATPPTREPKPGILRDQVVWTTAPVRIDLAGGWTDTPPICSDMGGQVVNVAITLNDQYPIQAMCRLRSEGGIRVTSVDLGRSVVIRSARELTRFEDPTDWAALAKAALVLSGLKPHRNKGDLASWLRHLGGGVDLTFFSAVPKGSGLGTSSILGAAILASLARTLGEKLSHELLIERTSILEQMMSTGGGWQDQVGGIVPGVKYMSTRPGARQVPSVRPMLDSLSEPGMRERLLLYYTGHRRLAKNILQQVVSRYLERDPATLAVLEQLKFDAGSAGAASGSGVGMDLIRVVRAYWQSKMAIDPGSTTPAIEALLDPIRHELSAHMLPGAGGGGFVFMIARTAAAAARVRKRLLSPPPNALARFYDFKVDHAGLRTAVL